MTTQSKTARASVRAAEGKSDLFLRNTLAPLFVPLGGGSMAYVYSSDGRTTRVRVDSRAFVELAGQLLAGPSAERARAELAACAAAYPGQGWDAVLAG